jgi:hypothetical protein
MQMNNMESLASAIKYLAERGIDVSPYSDNRFFCKRDGAPNVTLTATAEGFEFTYWDGCPGPAPDDFAVHYRLLDDVLLAVWCFFFAKPVVIDGWMIPLHRRPEWSLPTVQYRLANAVTIDIVRFQAIKNDRLRRASLNLQDKQIGLLHAQTTQFLAFAHQTRTDFWLMLRRDLEEGYVVEGSRGLIDLYE